MYGISNDRYDGYKLALLKPDDKCNITDAEWAEMNREGNYHNGHTLMVGWIRVNICFRFPLFLFQKAYWSIDAYYVWFGYCKLQAV